MSKTVKLLISIFVGLDIFAVCWVSLAEFRYNLFGMGEVPGLGSAADMGLFLAALLLGYGAGDRLFHFLNYNQRRKALLKKQSQPAPAKAQEPKIVELQERTAIAQTSIWDEGDWQDRPRENAQGEQIEPAEVGSATAPPHSAPR